MPQRTCSVPACSSPMLARALCSKHYARLRNRGTTDDPPKRHRASCTVGGCDRIAYGHRLCHMHYQRWKAGNTDMRPSRITPNGFRNAGMTCRVDKCARPAKCRGWCHMHYIRWRENGDPLTVKKPHRAAVINGEKMCPACGHARPLNQFVPNKTSANGRASHCNPCRSIAKRVARYELTRDQYLDMATASGGVCELCRRAPGVNGFVVDHDHTTGTVRGLLCSRCNSALGLFGDDAKTLQAAAEYLRSHNEDRAPS